MELYLAAIVGHGRGEARAALAAKAKLNVARQVRLGGQGGLTAHTEGGGGEVGGDHVLHLAERTSRRDDRAAHVAQNRLASRGERRGERGETARHGRERRGEAPGGRGEAAAQGAGVAGGLRALEDSAAEIAHVDVVASLVVDSLQVRQEGGHLLYR